MSSATMLRAALQRMPGPRLTVDLRAVSYLDAAGVRVLREQAGRDLRLPATAGSAVAGVLAHLRPGPRRDRHAVGPGAVDGRPEYPARSVRRNR